MGLKICRVCGEAKPLTEYRERSDSKYSWHESQCHSCQLLAQRKWAKANPERTRETARASYARHREENNIADRRRYYENPKRREYNIKRAQERGRTPPGKAWRKAYQHKWRERNPEKYRAQTALNNALRDGKLVKGNCVCGESEGVVGHHHDYSQPLDVVWMCRRCHGLEHRKGLPGAGGGGAQAQ